MNLLTRMLTAAFLASVLCGAATATEASASAGSAAETAAKAPENPLVPTAEDMEKAREARKAGYAPKVESRHTEINQVRDQDNRVVEYVVTPGSTHIPYTIENRADRPIDNTPGGNSKSTTGTTRQFRIGW